jgi:hypothetical protein
MSEVGSRRSEVGGRRCSQDIGNTFCIRSLPSFLIATVRDSAGHVARPSRSIDSLYPKAHRPSLAGLTVHLAPLPLARFYFRLSTSYFFARSSRRRFGQNLLIPFSAQNFHLRAER